ncbi:HGxxPAAW family protein [uncultured Microbacterium sp.]|uniref:HGxxPAAW family protein n=1 Tax=uncultured Microbacterium sp. TaxID=191216 RepID=UPI002627A2ED|nr:HGxxPAAW family protein [uncultured Microbacterium sp.]
MTNPIADPGHGHSPAAWTAVVIMLLGFTAGTVFFCAGMPTLVWASVGVMAVGLIIGWIMAKAGYGVNGPKYSPKGH